MIEEARARHTGDGVNVCAVRQVCECFFHKNKENIMKTKNMLVTLMIWAIIILLGTNAWSATVTPTTLSQANAEISRLQNLQAKASTAAEKNHYQNCINQAAQYRDRVKNALTGFIRDPGPMPSCPAGQNIITQQPQVTITTGLERSNDRLDFTITTNLAVARVVLVWDNGTATMTSTDGKKWTLSLNGSQLAPAGGNKTITAKAYQSNSAVPLATRAMNVTVQQIQTNAKFVSPVTNPNKNNAVTYYISGTNKTQRYSSYFNKEHLAWDYGSSCGTQIKSIYPGVVKAVVRDTAYYGNRIVIEHVYNGNKFYSLYAHLASTHVSTNATVQSGQVIGTMGNSGNTGGFVHLHIAVWSGNYTNNPTQQGTIVGTDRGQNAHGTFYSIAALLSRQGLW
jgi:murein DD-endopeptidase MepM/ murein hydrolase activator NlpD